MAESVKVAVRVRPFNSREKERGSKCCIQMTGAQTKIQNPETPNEEPRTFAFDYSYWSHDGFEEDEKGILKGTSGSNYASQDMVFNDLGQGVLDNAFKGFNCSLFAYGQTGAGKSYSMVGYGPNKGIVPITCDVLFQTMEKGDPSIKYEVTFSMLEIYNEQVRDLLQKSNPKGGLPVRQNPKEGIFFVQGLTKTAVGSYKEIEARIDEGTSNRTVAATQMNATSSRAHTVVTIQFDQISKNDVGQETKKSSVINLVDLAGSERADSTGATGDRLKEGANINKSLSALGNVISALADLSMGKKKVMVPYRDSVLTKLLQNALGGNSKTIMIAALSPADINHDETLGTLRYADRAKKIKNKAVVNENPVEKLIRELREENEKLKNALSGGSLPAVEGSSGMSPEDIAKMKKQMEDEIRAQLLANEESMNDMDWDTKLKHQRQSDETTNNAKAQNESRKNKEPHLANLNEDNMLSGVVVQFLGASETTIGRKDASPEPTIILSGLSIQKQHAVVNNENGEVVLKPGSAGAKIKVNGVPLMGSRTLQHLDRIVFGSNHMYVFKNPLNPSVPEGTPSNIDWEFAQKELAAAKGFTSFGSSGLSKDQQRAQDQILEMLPMINEVNAVSEELNKHKAFEIVLISGAAQEGTNKETKVLVKMKNLLNGNVWLWDRGKFINRRYVVQDLYQRYLDGDEDVLKIPKEEDPFWEPAEDVLIGTANVFLQSLGYALDFDDKIVITDFKGNEEGHVIVNVTPCTQDGKAVSDEDSFVEEPSELLGKPFHFKVTVRSGEVTKSRYSRGLTVKYKYFDEKDYCQSQTLKDTLSPEWNFSRVISCPSISQEHLDFFESQSITFMLYGTQVDSDADPRLAKLTTKELRQMDTMKDNTQMSRKQTGMAGSEPQDEVTQLKSELVLMRRKFERLSKKEARLQGLCQEWIKKPREQQEFQGFLKEVKEVAHYAEPVAEQPKQQDENELCKTWSNKPPEEQEFDAFYRAVSAVANSTGTRLKTRVQMLNKMLQGQRMIQEKKQLEEDMVSVYSFELDLPPPDPLSSQKTSKESEDNEASAIQDNGVINHGNDANNHSNGGNAIQSNVENDTTGKSNRVAVSKSDEENTTDINDSAHLMKGAGNVQAGNGTVVKKGKDGKPIEGGSRACNVM